MSEDEAPPRRNSIPGEGRRASFISPGHMPSAVGLNPADEEYENRRNQSTLKDHNRATKMMTESPMPFRTPVGTAEVKKEVPEMHLESEREEPEVSKDFMKSHGLTGSQAKELLDEFGRNELVDKSDPKW